jgi:putative ABC transport system substrate-binding protein
VAFSENERLQITATIAGKWLELLKEIAPRVNRAAFLFNPATTPFRDIYLKPFKAAAASLALEAIAAPVHYTPELESVVAAHAREPNGSLIVMPDGFLNVHRAEIVLLAARYHLPTVYPWRFFAEIGGLLSYGSVQSDMFRTAATYVDRILKGEKPADLPVQAPTKYELVVNLKTAKALGLDASVASAARRQVIEWGDTEVHHAARRRGGMADCDKITAWQSGSDWILGPHRPPICETQSHPAFLVFR